jgi:hypothetical protein
MALLAVARLSIEFDELPVIARSISTSSTAGRYTRRPSVKINSQSEGGRDSSTLADRASLDHELNRHQAALSLQVILDAERAIVVLGGG